MPNDDEFEKRVQHIAKSVKKPPVAEGQEAPDEEEEEMPTEIVSEEEEDTDPHARIPSAPSLVEVGDPSEPEEPSKS